MRLGTQGSSGPHFDIASSPLADFHHCERLHQEILHKVDRFLAITVLTPFSVQLY